MNRNFIYIVPESILFDITLNLLEIKIYMIIRSFMDSTGTCYPSNNWLANKCEVDRRSIIRSLNTLIEKGYIVKHTINNQRKLFIKQTGCPEELVTQMSPPSDTDVTPPSDTDVTQLVSNINNKNNIKHIPPKSPKGDCAINTNYQYPETLYSKEKPVQKPRSTAKTNVAKVTNDNPHGIPEELIDEWRQTRKTKITPTAWKRLNAELSKCTCAPIEAFEEMISRGWSTVKAEWINRKTNTASNITYFDHESTDWIKGIEKDMF